MLLQKQMYLLKRLSKAGRIEALMTKSLCVSTFQLWKNRGDRIKKKEKKCSAIRLKTERYTNQRHTFLERRGGHLNGFHHFSEAGT